MELKPCPFCGCKVELRSFAGRSALVEEIEICCLNCGVRMTLEKLREYVALGDRASVVDIWNRRADKKPEWISVDDRMPESNMHCAICGIVEIENDKHIATERTWFINGVFGNTLVERITHWLPSDDLPSPPPELVTLCNSMKNGDKQ